MSYTARAEIAQSAHPDCARIAHAARICRRVPRAAFADRDAQAERELREGELFGLDVTVPGMCRGLCSAMSTPPPRGRMTVPGVSQLADIRSGVDILGLGSGPSLGTLCKQGGLA